MWSRRTAQFEDDSGWLFDAIHTTERRRPMDDFFAVHQFGPSEVAAGSRTPATPKIRILRPLNHDMDEPGLANVANATGRLTKDGGTWCGLQRPLIDLHP